MCGSKLRLFLFSLLLVMNPQGDLEHDHSPARISAPDAKGFAGKLGGPPTLIVVISHNAGTNGQPVAYETDI